MSTHRAPEEESSEREPVRAPWSRPSYSNMDTELFMECEEEELEPWQQVDDSVEEDDMDFLDAYCEPVEDSLSPLPASESPPPRTPPPTTPASTGACAVTTVTHASSASPPVRIISSVRAHPSIITTTSSGLPPSSAANAPPLMAQAPPLFLTQTAGGQTFLVPATAGTGSTQSIFLTTQGFQMPAMMNSGTSLLLNLQPGQTMQPLTLIQSPSLGQLVRPSVGVSPVLPQGQTRPALSGGPAQPGSAFMQLPATLTLRTSAAGPVNLQVTQVGGAKSLKLAGAPALPSGSANGVSRFAPPSSGTAPRPAPPVTMTPIITSMAAVESPRVVMSVEEFYYGTFNGDLSLRIPQPLGIKTSTFTCQICSQLAENNLRLMQHMLQHSELIAGGGERQCCQFCYRQFSSATQLQNHQDQVHGQTPSSCMCRICEWAFENEPAFLNHMKSNHKPGEMPYVCQVCLFRSSFYSDVLQHFASFHRDSRFLLCVFCLKVTRNPATYQQHLLRHQVNQAFHCNRCRLQFVFLKDKMQHKLENHRSFRRPAKLDGLPPGSKVTVRTYGKLKPPMTSAGSRLLQSPATIIQPIKIKTELQKPLVPKSSSVPRSPRSPTKRGSGRRDPIGRASYGDGDRLVCLECGTDASDVSAHYPTHVHCLLCPYSSCCSRAYAAHMIHHHVPRSREKVLPLHRLPPPCVFLLRCSRCGFRPQSADRMADHLVLNPDHHSATCWRQTFVEPDIQFCHSGRPSVDLQEPGQNQDSDQFWRSARCWKPPSESAQPSIAPFTQTCGPYHGLAKNSDAIDFFNLLFPAALVDLITKETNAHAKTSRFLGAGSPDWTPVTSHEIKGFLGLVVLMGIHNLPDPAHYWSWNHFDNSYTFYRAMSLKRFKQIAANIRMGCFDYRGAGNPGDPLHIFRPMLDILGGAMWKAYRPNCCLTIDRALLPSLEEDGPHTKADPRTQPQVWLLCDSKSGYCHRFFIQLGETGGRDPGLGVVPELVTGLEDKHHQLYLANSLTSIPLMQKLLDQGIYASSSFPPPNPILPRELWEEGQLEKPGDFQQRQFGPLLVTRWKDTKEMGCLSTNAAPGEADTVWRRSQSKVGGLDPISRPMAFSLLQENMRGVDICKQLLACNPLGGITQDRHWRNLFWFLVNLSIVNAFIVLRESRKENPPAWVQDGLFTQVNFRKRLGNQLAKCAQKYFENMEIAGSRGTRVEVPEEPVKQRHRMGKISSISKRCKNCTLKNVRRESVYGCLVCKANLCKHPSCFWEFHGLSPLNKGSTKVGFLKDRISGAVEVVEVPENVDEAMGPVEDLDFSDDEQPDDFDDAGKPEILKKEFIAEDKRPASGSPLTTGGLAQPAAMLPGGKDREDFLSARQLRIGLFALCDGLRQATRVFSTETRLIRAWMKEARRRLTQTDPEQRGGGSERLVSWVMSMREQQLPITESGLFHKASTLKKKGAFSDSFRISYDWAVGFLLQHRLGVRSVGRVASLVSSPPALLEKKVRSFREFTQKVVRVHQLADAAVAAMDELCLFVDLRLAQDKARRAEALEVTGSVPLVTVYLTVLSDGTMLPSLVLPARLPPHRVLPPSVLLPPNAEGLSVEDMLDLWTNKVWLQHLSGPDLPGKSLLVLDRHREHLGDQFLASVSGSRCLPAVIPAGCSSFLQPLEVALKPALQRFLLARWTRFTATNPPELEETAPLQLQANVIQRLVDWLVEALAHLNQLPHLLQQSFQLAAVLPASGIAPPASSLTPPASSIAPPASSLTPPASSIAPSASSLTPPVSGIAPSGRKPEDLQSDIHTALMEVLLGAEATGSPEFLELEDEDEAEEEQDGGDDQDTKDEGMEVDETGKDGEMEADRKDTKYDRRPDDKQEDETIRDKVDATGDRTEETRTGEEEGKEAIEEERGEGKEMIVEENEEGKETMEDENEDGKETIEDENEEGKETIEEREEGKETIEEREDGKETMEDENEEGKETIEEREEGKETIEEREEGKETMEDENEVRKETIEEREEGKETMEDENEVGKETIEEREEGKETIEEEREEGKETIEERGEGKETIEEEREEGKETMEDSEEEEKETEEDRRELSKERRETRIVIGEEVGDEWKLTVKSRTESVEAEEEDKMEDKMDRMEDKMEDKMEDRMEDKMEDDGDVQTVHTVS